VRIGGVRCNKGFYLYGLGGNQDEGGDSGVEKGFNNVAAGGEMIWVRKDRD